MKRRKLCEMTVAEKEVLQHEEEEVAQNEGMEMVQNEEEVIQN